MNPLQSFINNPPEANLKLLADNPQFLTTTVKEKESHLFRINFALRAVAMAIAAIAFGILSSFGVITYSGFTLVFFYIILVDPLHRRLYAPYERKVILDYTNLMQTVKKMVDCVDGRFQLTHFYLSTAGDIESHDKIEEVCLEREKNLFKMVHGLKDIQQLKDCLSPEEHSRQHFSRTIDQLKGCDFSTSITELRTNIDKIAKINFTDLLLKDNCTALTSSCKKYAIPYEQYYQKKKNGKLVYKQNKIK